MLTGLRKTSHQHLQLGAGLFLRDFDWTDAKDAGELKEKIANVILKGEGVIGATRGGGTFQCRPETRQLDADGARYATRGRRVNDCWVVKMTGTMLEITPENFAGTMMGAEVTREGRVTTVRARTDVVEESFIRRLCWVGDTSRGFVLIELDNALNVSGANFTFTDKGEGVLPFEFQAHKEDGEDDDYAPFRILFFEEMEGVA